MVQDLLLFVIPVKTELAPHLMRGIHVSILMVPCFRRDGVWIPAIVYPAP
jgi:hypothetical protein